MPELPEVEVTRMGIEPHIKDKTIAKVIVRNGKLRWPVPDELQLLVGQVVDSIERRAKYLLLNTKVGSAILHLGMSGKLCVVEQDEPLLKHDHIDVVFTDGLALRYNDPRRFGAFLWHDPQKDGDITQHQVLAHLGPEPFDSSFTGEHLFTKAQGKKTAVKQFIMDNKIVVGVGNIYANESLYKAGIDPRREAGSISLQSYQQLAPIIVDTLQHSIAQGGTTLKDFLGADGKPGYFAQELLVYGRKGEMCIQCEHILQEIRLGQRSTVFCPECQQ